MRILKKTFLNTAVLFLIWTLGCGGSSTPYNSIRIESIVPDSANAGQSTTFTVAVTYNLQTSDNGLINYCFSAESFFSDRFSGCPSPISGSTTTVSRGRGTITIAKTMVLTQTGTLNVFLQPIQDSNSTDSAVSDMKTIQVVQ